MAQNKSTLQLFLQEFPLWARFLVPKNALVRKLGCLAYEENIDVMSYLAFPGWV